MKRLTLVVLGCALALTPSTAWAKEITGATICGGDGCRSVKDDRLLASLVAGGPPTSGPRGKLEHFVARFTVQGEGETVRFSNVVLPEKGLIQGEDGTWMRMTPAGRRTYLALTADRTPRAAARMADSKPLPEARVDETVLPPETSTMESTGGASVWPWVIGGAVAAIGLALLLARRRGWPGAPAGVAR